MIRLVVVSLAAAGAVAVPSHAGELPVSETATLLVSLEPGGSIGGEVLGLGPRERRGLTVVAHEPTYGGRLGFVEGGGR